MRGTDSEAKVEWRHLACMAVAAVACAGAHAQTLRMSFTGPLETLDPQRASSMFAQGHAGTLYDQLLTYDYFVRPVSLVPLAAAAMPEVSADGREYTFRLRPGIHFAPHPAFGGIPRELVAEDFAFSLKRLADPTLGSPSWGLFQGAIEGLDSLRDVAIAAKRELDYDAPVAGIEAVDRYTLRVRLARDDRSFVFLFASPVLSAVPREVVVAEGAAFGSRPVGSGPYAVADFQPNTRLVLVRNPVYRKLVVRDIAPGAPSGSLAAAAIASLPYPANARVELTHVPEPSAARLALERGELDVVRITEPSMVLKNDRLDPALAKAGVQLVRGTDAGSAFLLFNMRDDVIGGVSRSAMALRRAIAMAFDDREFIAVIEAGAAELRAQPVPPGVDGHFVGYRSRNAFDRASANALLDRTGFVRGADGWRRRPDGSELRLTMLIGTSSVSRQYAQFVERMVRPIGVRVVFDPMPGSERMSRIFRCRFQLTTMDWGLDTPDGSNMMLAFHGKAAGTVGLSCLEDAAFDADYVRMLAMPPGAARAPLYASMLDRLETLMPARVIPYPQTVYLSGPNVRGLATHPAMSALFPYVAVSANSR